MTDRAVRDLSNLLAMIHRDGGHYEAKHGTEKAVEDAKEIVCEWRTGLNKQRVPNQTDQRREP